MILFIWLSRSFKIIENRQDGLMAPGKDGDLRVILSMRNLCTLKVLNI